LLRKDKISSRGAPSLLTSAQQAEAERNRILSTLEASDGERKRAPKTAPAASPGAAARIPWAWLMFGIVVAVAAGGAGLWYGQQSASAPTVLAASAQQAESAPVSTPMAASAPATEVDPAPSAATIQDDGAAHAAQGAGQSLSDMLEADPGAASAPGAHASAAQPDAAPGANGDVLSQALEAPSGAALAAAAAAPAVARAAPKAAPAKPKPPVKRVAARKAAPAAQDTDAMLLSALIAHANAAEPPKKARPSLEQELKACRKQPKADLAACRERACDGRSNVGLCKVQR